MDYNVSAFRFRCQFRWIGGKLVWGIPGPWGFAPMFPSPFNVMKERGE